MVKKKAEMTISTIVAIALAVVVLIFLIYGFSTGWGNLWDKITNFAGQDSNVGTLTQACQLACMPNNDYEYCTRTRTLNTGTGTFTVTCGSLNSGIKNGETEKSATGVAPISCNEITTC